MWHSAAERHKWLQCNRCPCTECNRHVVLMVRIRHHIPNAMYRKGDSGAASVNGIIYNATGCKTMKHGMKVAAGEVSKATPHLCDGSCVILHHRVRGFVRAIRNTRVFLTETRFVAVVGCPILLSNCFKENSVCFRLFWAFPSATLMSYDSLLTSPASHFS